MVEDIASWASLFSFIMPVAVLVVFIRHYRRYVSTLRREEEGVIRDVVASSFNRAVSYVVRVLALRYARDYFGVLRDKVIDDIVAAFERIFDVIEGRPGWKLKPLAQRKKEFKDYIRKKAEDVRRYLDEAIAELARQAMAEEGVIDVFQEISALGEGVLRSVEKELAEIYRRGYYIAVLRSRLGSIKSHLALIMIVMTALIVLSVLELRIPLGPMIISICSTAVLILYYFMYAENILRQVSEVLHVSYEGPWSQIIGLFTLKKPIKSDKEVEGG